MGINQKPEFRGMDDFLHPDMNADEKADLRKDPAWHLAEFRGQFLEILHIPSGQSIKFKAYISDFQDKYDANWQSTDVYGRMDPVHQYQGTSRVISLDWVVPAYSVAEAKFNHEKSSLLFSMLYPNYTDNGVNGRSSATQISTAPIFKVKFGNLIQDPTFGAGEGTVEDAGLIGAISGFTYAPNIEAGFIDNTNATGYRNTGLLDLIQRTNSYANGFIGQMYPKEVKLAMDYTVFHTNALGWNGTNKRTLGFPYGEDLGVALTSVGQGIDTVLDTINETGRLIEQGLTAADAILNSEGGAGNTVFGSIDGVF